MRRSIMILTAAALAIPLAACGGGQTTGAGGSPSPSASKAGGTLTVWVDDTRGPAVRAAATRFEKETGATVRLVQKNFDDIRPDFLAQVPTGKGPDLTVGAHDWLGEFIANGVVAPVELGNKATTFEDVALKAFTYNGQVYGLPYAIENVALIRNAALTTTVPKTFDEMIAAGKKAGTKYPFLIQISETGDPYTMYPFQTSFGAPVFKANPDGSYTSQLTMGGPKGNAFAQWLARAGKAGTLNTAWTYDIVVEAFAKGQSPYLVGGPWMLDQFKDMKLAIDPIPSAGGQPSRPFTGVQGFYVSARSQNQVLATDFLVNYLATKDAQLALYRAGHRTPALTAAADEVATDPIAAGFRTVGENALPMPSIPEMGAVWNYWGVTEANIISGSLAPVAGWEKMISDIQGAIAKG